MASDKVTKSVASGGPAIIYTRKKRRRTGRQAATREAIINDITRAILDLKTIDDSTKIALIQLIGDL